jgi:ABC-type antimicrobial peptide transport system permease subunit
LICGDGKILVLCSGLASGRSGKLVFGIVGVCGVVAYAVVQRRSEIGIRAALGARAAAVKAMFLRQGLLLVSSGIALGLIAAAGFSRWMSSLLFGVTPFDPVTYGAMAAAHRDCCHLRSMRTAQPLPNQWKGCEANSDDLALVVSGLFGTLQPSKSGSTRTGSL